MRHQNWKQVILAAAAFSLTAMVPLAVGAQDRPEEHHEQKPDDHGTAGRDDHGMMGKDDHGMMGKDDHHDDARPDPVVQYRHDHPRASARCHDGFFTSTRDHGRACTKHGGIDVWLSP